MVWGCEFKGASLFADTGRWGLASFCMGLFSHLCAPRKTRRTAPPAASARCGRCWSRWRVAAWAWGGGEGSWHGGGIGREEGFGGFQSFFLEG